MTQTIGYWCDECRTKYVQHVCKDGLPCGHDLAQAVHVSAKSYGRGGAEIWLKWDNQKLYAFLEKREQEDRVVYIGWRAKELRGTIATHTEGQEVLIDWLHKQPAKIIRAFLGRWESCKSPPEWRMIETLQSPPEIDLGKKQGA